MEQRRVGLTLLLAGFALLGVSRLTNLQQAKDRFIYSVEPQNEFILTYLSFILLIMAVIEIILPLWIIFSNLSLSKLLCIPMAVYIFVLSYSYHNSKRSTYSHDPDWHSEILSYDIMIILTLLTYAGTGSQKISSFLK